MNRGEFIKQFATPSQDITDCQKSQILVLSKFLNKQVIMPKNSRDAYDIILTLKFEAANKTDSINKRRVLNGIKKITLPVLLKTVRRQEKRNKRLLNP